MAILKTAFVKNREYHLWCVEQDKRKAVIAYVRDTNSSLLDADRFDSVLDIHGKVTVDTLSVLFFGS